MSNLSELLPAGAGAKSASFVASGTLPSGQTVALKADGTVEAVSGSSASQSVGSPVSISNNTRLTIQVYDEQSQKIVLFFTDGANSNYPTAIVGTVSGSSISFGSSVVISSAAVGICSACYDSSQQKILFAYYDAGIASSAGIVGTVSGTSISFGSKYVFQSGSSAPYGVAYDSVAQKNVIFFQEGGSGKAVVATMTGSALSFGSIVTFSVTQIRSDGKQGAIYDPSSGKIIFCYSDYLSSLFYGTAIVGTVSGTTISFGTPVIFESSNCNYFSCIYEPIQNKIVASYFASSSVISIVGTVSGTSISFGSSIVIDSATNYISSCYDINAKKITIAYTKSYVGYAVAGAVSGNSISFDSPISVDTNSYRSFPNSGYDQNSKKVVLNYSYAFSPSGSDSRAFVWTNEYSDTNSADFIGITDQAIADTATGAVIVQGGVSDKVTGLTTGSDYYVQSDGSLSTTISSVPAGRALSSTSILLEG